MLGAGAAKAGTVRSRVGNCLDEVRNARMRISNAASLCAALGNEHSADGALRHWNSCCTKDGLKLSYVGVVIEEHLVCSISRVLSIKS